MQPQLLIYYTSHYLQGNTEPLEHMVNWQAFLFFFFFLNWKTKCLLISSFVLPQKEKMVSSSRNKMRNEKPVALINRAKHILMAAPERNSGTKTVTVCTLCSHASCKHDNAWRDSHVTHCRWAVPSEQRLWKFICLEFKPPAPWWPIWTDDQYGQITRTLNYSFFVIDI